MLVNISLAIRYGSSLRLGPNLMELVKGLPTYTSILVIISHKPSLSSLPTKPDQPAIALR